MLYSSPLFLFLFLPVTLALHFPIGPRFRNLFLLIASLLFYVWGEGTYVVVLDPAAMRPSTPDDKKQSA